MVRQTIRQARKKTDKKSDRQSVIKAKKIDNQIENEIDGLEKEKEEKKFGESTLTFFALLMDLNLIGSSNEHIVMSEQSEGE